MSEPNPTNQRVIDAAKANDLTITVSQMGQSTRTAEDAAAACNCTVGQIVKSLVFRGRTTGTPFLLLVSGANRVDERAVARDLGEKLRRPDADDVRELTGFAIGGIPPLGHRLPLKTFIDQDLLAFDVVWAAAGTPTSVFDVAPSALARATDATVIMVN
jgi:prolyl-tRNA editing enzyme YbaK/EbsC (Cys-tRNA(Pro) deacylase)